MRSRCARLSGVRLLMVALVGSGVAAALLSATAPLRADEPCFAPRVYRPLNRRDPQRAQEDLDLANDLEAGRQLSEEEQLARLDTRLSSRLAVLRGLVRNASGGTDLTVTSNYRPYAYQQHFRDIALAFRRLRRSRRYVATDSSGRQLQFRESAPAAYRARWSTQLGCVNTEVAKHGFKLNRHGYLAVSRPRASKHPRGLAVDLTWAATGLTDEQIDQLACRSGLHRPYKRSDPVHFELVPRRGTRMCKILTLRARPAAGGEVTADPAGPWFSRGDTALVTATANPGFVFRRWVVRGAARCAPGDCSVTLNRNVLVIAQFRKAVAGSGGLEIASAIAAVTGETATSKSFEFVLQGTAGGPVGAELTASQDRPLPEELTCAAWTRVSTFPPVFRRQSGQAATCSWTYRETIGLPKAALPVTISVEMTLYDPVKRRTTRLSRDAQLN